MSEINKALIIGFCGKARSGKDTAAALIKNAVGSDLLFCTSVRTFAFADPMREMLRIGFGLTDEHFSMVSLKEKPMPEWNNVSPRQLLQELGTGFGRRMDPDVWVKNMRMRIKGSVSKTDLDNFAPLHVITDVRTDNEAALIQNLGGFVFKVVRSVSSDVRKHVTENGISPDLIDDTIENNGDLSEFGVNINRVLLNAFGS